MLFLFSGNTSLNEWLEFKTWTVRKAMAVCLSDCTESEHRINYQIFDETLRRLNLCFHAMQYFLNLIVSEFFLCLSTQLFFDVFFHFYSVFVCYLTVVLHK